MKFILAPDSFKESMTAKQACQAMERGIKKVMPDAMCISLPLADGGEGTMQTLCDITGGTIYQQRVKGPLGESLTAEYAILGDDETAVVEIASASGLHLVKPADRNPMLTSTYGTGQLLRAALTHPIKTLIIGLGGSATNDGGAGIMQALGVRFLDETGHEIGHGGGQLCHIASIDTNMLITRNSGVDILIATDVTNPLTGLNGASTVFGPQKGADADMVEALDANLAHYAEKISQYLNVDVLKMEGGGAAGGAGAGLMAFLKGRQKSGIDLVLEYSHLEDELHGADYIFTGEGSIDAQTLNGKTIAGLAVIAKKHQKPLIVFAGRVSEIPGMPGNGITAAFDIVTQPCTLPQALEAGPENLEKTVAAIVRLIAWHR